ncbi:hypothetical protein HPP92_002161 [Vanilla planifolia]|uniref:Uncharacterized protein n=1 Tax=Vanilla planifolia TaxID=51239 RepID=A0A835VIP4_VANPL|nr:hypothetical protein HPP92_002161 [Vanilla planifolia]
MAISARYGGETPLRRRVRRCSVLSFLRCHFESSVPLPNGSRLFSMVLFRRYASIIVTFFAGFGYLVACHVYYMSGDAWKEGGIDATGALMVLILKYPMCYKL